MAIIPFPGRAARAALTCGRSPLSAAVQGLRARRGILLAVVVPEPFLMHMAASDVIRTWPRARIGVVCGDEPHARRVRVALLRALPRKMLLGLGVGALGAGPRVTVCGATERLEEAGFDIVLAIDPGSWAQAGHRLARTIGAARGIAVILCLETCPPLLLRAGLRPVEYPLAPPQEAEESPLAAGPWEHAAQALEDRYDDESGPGG
jgi:hypothetical protein